MEDISFRSFVEFNDVFGFEKEIAKAQSSTNSEADEELPIERFNLMMMMNRLSKNNLNGKLSKSNYITEMQWGQEPGSVKVVITPKLNVRIQRLHHDKLGESVWLMKKYFYIDDNKYGGKEDIVADEIFEQVKLVAQQEMDAPIKSNLESVALSLAARLRRQTHNMLYYQGLNKLSENEYQVIFNLAGGGRGRLLARTKMVYQLAVDFSYNEETGLYKAFITPISSVSEGEDWALQTSEFEEYYMPTQSKNEIIDSIVTTLKWW